MDKGLVYHCVLTIHITSFTKRWGCWDREQVEASVVLHAIFFFAKWQGVRDQEEV